MDCGFAVIGCPWAAAVAEVRSNDEGALLMEFVVEGGEVVDG